MEHYIKVNPLIEQRLNQRRQYIDTMEKYFAGEVEKIVKDEQSIGYLCDNQLTPLKEHIVSELHDSCLDSHNQCSFSYTSKIPIHLKVHLDNGINITVDLHDTIKVEIGHTSSVPAPASIFGVRYNLFNVRMNPLVPKIFNLYSNF